MSPKEARIRRDPIRNAGNLGLCEVPGSAGPSQAFSVSVTVECTRRGQKKGAYAP